MHTPDQVIALSPMAEIEERLGLDPVETLLHQRRALVEKVADLRARFGSFGTFDHIRKSELARLAGKLRAEYTAQNVKVTEAQLDQQAHAHPEYIRLITEATTQRAEWALLESDIEAIEWTIRRGDMIGRYLSSEARL